MSCIRFEEPAGISSRAGREGRSRPFTWGAVAVLSPEVAGEYAVDDAWQLVACQAPPSLIGRITNLQDGVRLDKRPRKDSTKRLGE